jgi:hypothetical protein
MMDNERKEYLLTSMVFTPLVVVPDADLAVAVCVAADPYRRGPRLFVPYQRFSANPSFIQAQFRCTALVACIAATRLHLRDASSRAQGM